MKHIKPYKIFEGKNPHPGFPTTEEEIHRLCENHEIHNYIINEDLSIDVEGDIYLSNISSESIPFNFNYVSGNFECDYSELQSLKGSPKIVNGDFDCSYNDLESLKYSPEEVGGNFNCSNNQLTSLDGAPNKVVGDFYCNHNKLKTLKGLASIIGGHFSCIDNILTSLKYTPEEIGAGIHFSDNLIDTLQDFPKKINGNFDGESNEISSLYNLPSGIDYESRFTSFKGNPIYTLSHTFIEKDNTEELITEFNDYHIVRGNKVVLNRLKAFINDFDLDMPNLDEVKEYYTIV